MYNAENLGLKRGGHVPLRLLAFFLLALLLRLLPWGYYVTPDEPMWVFRAVRFADAVAAGDYGAVPQTGHPGVTTMLLGALGIRLTSWVHPTASQAHLAWIRKMAWLAPENAEAFPHLVAFLGAGRGLVAVVTSAGVAMSYALARRRLGEMAGRLLALFLALDPFFAGHAGLLHTDALQATFVLLAVLLALPQERKRGGYVALAGAALCLALAGLTKTLGLLVAPGLALGMLLLERGSWKLRFLRVLFLAALSLVFLLAFYPPFWVDPRQALASLVGAVTYHEGLGLRDVFFMGRMTSDPGPWFYPAVLLFRLIPPVLIGGGMALVRAIACRLRRESVCRRDAIRSPVAWFALPVGTYLVALSIAHKKFDRYALSGMLLLTAIAAVTWARFWARHRRRPGVARWGRAAILVALWLPWAFSAPLPLTYADPFLGGPWLAQHIVPLGWGEAFGLSTMRLTRVLRAEPTLPEPTSLTLLTPNVPGTASFFPGRTRSWDPELLPCTEALVLGGRDDIMSAVGGSGSPSEAFESVTQVRLAGRTLGRGFLRTARAPLTACTRLDAIAEDRPPLARFSGALMLQAAAWPQAARGPNALPLDFRWYPQAPQRPLHIQVYLEDGQHLVWAEGGGQLVDRRTWPASVWEVNRFIESETHVGIPLDMPPGTYTLTLSVFDHDGRQLGYWGPQGVFGGTRLPLGAIEISPAPYPATELALDQPLKDVVFAGLTLVGASVPPTAHWAGDPLPFQLGWMRTPGDPVTTLRWALACAEGSRDGGELPLAPADPAHWPVGYRYKTHYAPRTDPQLPEGDCALLVSAGDPVTSSKRSPVALGHVQVRARERTFILSHDPQIPLTIAAGDNALLVGVELATTTLHPGESFTLTLVWRAERPFVLDYTVFVHLVSDVDGHTWAQSDRWPQGGDAPTSTWVPHQIIMDTHTLTLPPDTPPGRYTLFAGLYDAERGGRVPLYDHLGSDQGAPVPDDRAPLHEILVVSGATSDGTR